jgi:hypothetical protein
MQKTFKTISFLMLSALLMLTGCDTKSRTSDWEVISINEVPAIDIQFKVPPDWYVEYAPREGVTGQYGVALMPPKCSADQEMSYSDNCISLTIALKDQTEFDRAGFLSLISESIPIKDTEDEQTTLIHQEDFKVNGIDLQRHDHKMLVEDQEVQLSFIFFETESAYYYFIAEIPYDERQSDLAKHFDLMIETLEEIDE